MKILFRVNAGKRSGLGHLSRSLTIAKEFSERNHTFHFLINGDDIIILENFFESNVLSFDSVTFLENLKPQDDLIHLIKFFKNGKFDFLILDHYDHDKDYQLELKKNKIKWAQFDYTAKNLIFANVLINANIGVSDYLYKDLIEINTQMCVGEQYIIISNKFKAIECKAEVDRVLVAMGGSKYSFDLIEMINRITENYDLNFDVVTSFKDNFNGIKTRSNVNFHISPINPEDIYSKSSLAIVAGGVTTYELAYLKVPMIIIPFVANQVNNAVSWHQNRFGIFFNSIDDFLINIDKIGLRNIMIRVQNHFRPSLIIDGLGASRIVDKILDTIIFRR